MGEYADVKRDKIFRLLMWLETQNGFVVGNGGRHQWIIKHDSWERPFPIPFKHKVVNKHIVKELVQRILETSVCTKEQIDKNLK